MKCCFLMVKAGKSEVVNLFYQFFLGMSGSTCQVALPKMGTSIICNKNSFKIG